MLRAPERTTGERTKRKKKGGARSAPPLLRRFGGQDHARMEMGPCPGCLPLVHVERADHLPVVAVRRVERAGTVLRNAVAAVVIKGPGPFAGRAGGGCSPCVPNPQLATFRHRPIPPCRPVPDPAAVPPWPGEDRGPPFAGATAEGRKRPAKARRRGGGCRHRALPSCPPSPRDRTRSEGLLWVLPTSRRP